LLAVVALFAATTVAAGDARQGLQVIGRDAGPQVVATADLYYALSDIDSLIAGVLLIGEEHEFGIGRAEALDRYDERRRQAHDAILQADALAAGDQVDQQTVREVLEGLGRYEQLIARALQLSEQQEYAPGAAPDQVLTLYRQSTDLMRLDLLPKAYNLTLESSTIVRGSYESQRSELGVGVFLMVLAGVILLVLLVVLQVHVSRRFRRLVNPALALATLVTVVAVVGGVVQVSTVSTELRVAKEEGFDALLDYSRTQAISTSMQGDQSRYLLDPERADTYQQVYRDKALTVLYVPSVNLTEYYERLDDLDLDEYQQGEDDALYGFVGEQVDAAIDRGSGSDVTPALATLVAAYQEFQQADRRLREAAETGDREGAIGVRVGGSETVSAIDAFDAFDEALATVASTHRGDFDQAISRGNDAIRGWGAAVPIVALVVVALILVGVRPRLAEYR
jgi:hypothetical protein